MSDEQSFVTNIPSLSPANPKLISFYLKKLHFSVAFSLQGCHCSIKT